MSLAAAPSPEAPAAPRAHAGSGAAVLLALAAFTLVVAAASHLAIVHSRPLLVSLARTEDVAAQPLHIEATLRAMRPGEAPLVAVGSSVLDTDLDEHRLAGRFGVVVRPLPLYGGTIGEMAMLTPLLVHARPRGVVVTTTVWTLFDHVEWPEARLYDPRIAFELLTWREIVADRQAHGSHLLGSLHFVIRHRAALRERVGAEALRLLGLAPAPPAPAALHVPAAVRARWEALGQEFTCDGVNARALEVMARRLAEAGIPLFVVPTPANSSRDRDPALWRRLDQCLGQVASRTGAVVLPSPGIDDFPPSDFADSQHMNAGGRARFTDRVGALLQQALARRGAGRAVQ
jgi:hypothetical protein